MAQITRQEFDALMAQLLADNTTGAISPNDLRTVIDALMDSVKWYNEGTTGGSGGGDFYGPSSAVTDAPVLFSDTTGKVGKTGAVGQLVKSGGTTGQVPKKNSATDYDWSWGAVASGDVVGPASVTDGRAALFDGTTGKLLKQSSAAAILEGDSRLTNSRAPTAHTHVKADITDLGNIITNSTTGPLVASIPVYKGDGTNVTDPVPEVSVTALPDRFPYFETSGGEVVMAQKTGPQALSLMGGIANQGGADRVLTYDVNGDFSAATYATAYANIESGAPYTSRTVNWVGGTALTFSVADGRSIITDTLAADGTVSASWSVGVTEAMRPVRLIIPMDSTQRAITFAVGGEGLSKVNIPSSYTASRNHHFDLYREAGFPTVRYVGAGTFTSGSPQLVAFGSSPVNSATVGTLTPVAGTTFAIKANDLIICISYRPAGSAQPTLPSGYTDMSGTGGTWGSELTQPGVRAAWKVASVDDETIPAFTTAQQVHCYVFRKTGGTCSVALSSYAKNTYSGFTYSWPSLSISQNALIVGWMGLVNLDTGSLRSGLVEKIRLRSSTSATVPSFAISGISDLVSSWGSESVTTGTGGEGRRPFGQVAIY